jgi:hypothetical protein
MNLKCFAGVERASKYNLNIYIFTFLFVQDNLVRQLAKAQSEVDHWRHKYEKDGMAKVSDHFLLVCNGCCRHQVREGRHC